MRISVLVLIVALVQSTSLSTPAGAQTCPPPPPTPGAPAWFEFQVEQRAEFIAKNAVVPFPDPSLDQRAPHTSDFALAQFVIDTSGVPAPKSLKILARPEGLNVDSVTAALPRWRFTPAKVHGCVVPQLMQVALHWK